MSFTATNPFLTKGRWYKGNLHTHTTNSDGRLSLKQIVSSYKEKKYDFLAITDHNKITLIDEYSTSDFLLIKGIEIDCGRSEFGLPYHILGLGLKAVPELPEKMSAQEAIDIIRKRRGIVFLGHSYWSGLNLNDILPLKGILGVEVFNTHCHQTIGKGISSVHWDDLLAHGRNLYGFAVDDTHFPEAVGRGWIMVKAKSLSTADILSAIKKGQFYSSCGPVIKDIAFKNRTVTVRCSKAAAINFICFGPYGRSFYSEDGKLLTGASYDLSGQERYLRIEVIDARGKIAWSQPFFIKQ